MAMDGREMLSSRFLVHNVGGKKQTINFHVRDGPMNGRTPEYNASSTFSGKGTRMEEKHDTNNKNMIHSIERETERRLVCHFM